MSLQQAKYGVDFLRPHLNHRAQFLRKERGKRVHARRELKLHAHVPRERHLDRRGQQAAVGAVVIGEQAFFPPELLNRIPEGL